MAQGMKARVRTCFRVLISSLSGELWDTEEEEEYGIVGFGVG